MTKLVLAVGTLALALVLSGCVSGLGGGGGGNVATPAEGAIIQTEVVVGHTGAPENLSIVQPCLPLGTYARGMQPAWHVTVIDPMTGDALTNQTVDSVTVVLADGTKIPTEFHPDANQWHGCIILPDNQPLGQLQYTVNVVMNGQTYKSAGSIGVVASIENVST